MALKTTAEVCGMGHSMKRKEDPRFIRGQGHYVDDIKLPGMVHLDIVRSPYAHAKITAIHTEKALAIPGVLAVITGKTLEQFNLHWMPTPWLGEPHSGVGGARGERAGGEAGG